MSKAEILIGYEIGTAMLKDLGDAEKKLVKFVESQQRGVTQKEILEKCYGINGTSGGNHKTLRERAQKLSSLGIIRRDDRVAMSYPNIERLLRDELVVHGATDEEVAQVYNHIIAELLN